MTTNYETLVNLLRDRYPLPEWATFTELRNATGLAYTGAIDVAAFNVWPSGAGRRVACEIKMSRGDFMRELEQPAKRRWAAENFQETYFVTSLGVCEPTEIPEKWGLLTTTKKGDKLRRILVPTYRDLGDPDYLTVLTLLRRVCEDFKREQNRSFYLDGDKITIDDLEAVVREKVAESQKSIEVFQDQARQEVKKYHKLSKRLAEPLTTLRKIAQIGHYWRDVDEDAAEMTSEVVEDWFKKAEVETMRKSNKEILDIYHSMNRLVERLGIKDDG